MNSKQPIFYDYQEEKKYLGHSFKQQIAEGRSVPLKTLG